MRDKIQDKLLESIQVKEELMRTCIADILQIADCVITVSLPLMPPGARCSILRFFGVTTSTPLMFLDPFLILSLVDIINTDFGFLYLLPRDFPLPARI